MATRLPPRVFLDPQGRRQSPDEQELLKSLDQLYDEGKEERDRWAAKADLERDLKLYRGQVGPKNRDPYFAGNFIEAFVNRMVDSLTDTRPVLRVEPRKAGLRNVARVSGQVVQATWEDADMQRQAYKMCHKSAIGRSAGLYTGYDPETDEIVLEVLGLNQVVMDPMVAEAARLKKAEYLFIDRVKALDELKYKFVGRGAEVKADANIGGSDEEQRKRTVSGPLDQILKGDYARDALGRAKVKECFILDRQRDPKTGTLMFPGGRRIIRTRDLLLWDGPNIFWDGVWPVDWFDWIVDPEHPFGRSEPARLMYLQLAFNQVMDGLVENQLLTNFITFVADFDAVDDNAWKKLQNITSSLILRKRNRNATVTGPTPPPPFGADKIQLARFIFTVAQLITGVTDVTMGETPGSLQSGAAIEGLQEGAHLGTRSRASRLEDFYCRVGTKLLARIFQFRTSDQVIHLAGPTLEAVEYAIARQDFFMGDNQESLIDAVSVEGQFVKRREVFRSLAFRVAPGSSSASSRVRRAQLMLDLVKIGAASRKHLLQAADIPNPEEMLKEAKAEFAEMGPVAQAPRSAPVGP